MTSYQRQLIMLACSIIFAFFLLVVCRRLIAYHSKLLPCSLPSNMTTRTDNTVFVSFAGGARIHFHNQDMQKNKHYLNNREVFRKSAYYNMENIGSEYSALIGPEIASSTRGYHYWCWKPYIILREMEMCCEKEKVRTPGTAPEY